VPEPVQVVGVASGHQLDLLATGQCREAAALAPELARLLELEACLADRGHGRFEVGATKAGWPRCWIVGSDVRIR